MLLYYSIPDLLYCFFDRYFPIFIAYFRYQWLSNQLKNALVFTTPDIRFLKSEKDGKIIMFARSIYFYFAIDSLQNSFSVLLRVEIVYKHVLIYGRDSHQNLFLFGSFKMSDLQHFLYFSGFNNAPLRKFSDKTFVKSCRHNEFVVLHNCTRRKSFSYSKFI